MWQALPLSPLEHAGIVAGALLVYVLVTHIGQQRRTPSAAIAWVLAIAAFPYLALPLFLVFGTRKFARPARAGRPHRPERTDADTHEPQWPRELLRAMEVDPPGGNVGVTFHDTGEASLRALLALCASARSTLAVQTFLLREDAVGRKMVQALADAARRGVHTRLLLDAVGNLWLPRRVQTALAASGVSVLHFMPLAHNPLRGRTNLRNHRKLAVADGRRLWAGGRNLAGEYFIDHPGQPAWLDLSFRADGTLAESALAQFDADWRLAGGIPPPAVPASLGDMAGNGIPAQWLPSGPDRADDTVHALLLSAAWHARQRILAATPYFVPDEALLQAWSNACRRGVRVCLALPRRSNHRLADIAREQSLRQLVHAGAEVRLVPHMLHAKTVVMDDMLALCGSVNLDGRSLFLNYEATAVFYGHGEIEWLAQWIESAAARGEQHPGILPSLPRDVLEGLVRAVGFQL